MLGVVVVLNMHAKFREKLSASSFLHSSRKDEADAIFFRNFVCILRTTTTRLACVASVSVWFRSKEIPRKGTFGMDRARNETRATFLAVFD